MKLRSQLILAFLLLSVVPLTGIVLYSYVSSLGAFRQAVEAEAREMTEQIGQRMAAMTADVHRRVEGLGTLPFLALAGEARGGHDERLLESVQAALAPRRHPGSTPSNGCPIPEPRVHRTPGCCWAKCARRSARRSF